MVNSRSIAINATEGIDILKPNIEFTVSITNTPPKEGKI